MISRSLAIFALLLVLAIGAQSAGHLAAEATKGPTGASGKAWPLFRGDSEATGVAHADLPAQLEVLWKYETPQGGFEATATIEAGVVYIGNVNGDFVALDLATKRELWKRHTEGGFTASAAVRDGRVYCGDIDGKFYCWQASDGKPLWESTAGAEINSSANFYKNLVLFGSQDATLYAHDAVTGQEAWKFTIQDQIRCSPTVVDNRAFIAGCDGNLHIVDLDKGASAGSVKIDGPTGATPAVLGDRVYFGTRGGHVLCHRLASSNNRLGTPGRKKPAVAVLGRGHGRVDRVRRSGQNPARPFPAGRAAIVDIYGQGPHRLVPGDCRPADLFRFGRWPALRGRPAQRRKSVAI